MEDIRQILADNLTKLRKANNYTQIELGKKLGFTDKAVSKWEQGDTVPDIETLKKLSDLFQYRECLCGMEKFFKSSFLLQQGN